MSYKPREDGRPNFRGIGVAYGSMHGRAKLNEQLVTELRAQWNLDRYRTGFVVKQARRLGVTPSTVLRALTGETWTHLAGTVKAHSAPGKAEAAAMREALKRRQAKPKPRKR